MTSPRVGCTWPPILAPAYQLPSVQITNQQPDKTSVVTRIPMLYVPICLYTPILYPPPTYSYRPPSDSIGVHRSPSDSYRTPLESDRVRSDSIGVRRVRSDSIGLHQTPMESDESYQTPLESDVSGQSLTGV